MILKNEMQLFCRMVIGIPKESLDLCLEKLKDMHGVEVSAVKL
jgi:radical SAM superfamily enzyme